MEIVLERVSIAQKETLFRLLQYSLFEESLYDGNVMNDEALFEYHGFESYYTGQGRDAYFIRDAERNRLLGFAMIDACLKNGESGYRIEEFMILPQFRRKGIGSKAAYACFALHQGYWEVSPSLGSEQAYRFWLHAVE